MIIVQVERRPDEKFLLQSSQGDKMQFSIDLPSLYALYSSILLRINHPRTNNKNWTV